LYPANEINQQETNRRSALFFPFHIDESDPEILQNISERTTQAIGEQRAEIEMNIGSVP
jgi:hypothetical protein